MVHKDTRSRGTASRAMVSKAIRRREDTAATLPNRLTADILSKAMEAAMVDPHLGSMAVGISSSRLRGAVDWERLAVRLWA